MTSIRPYGTGQARHVVSASKTTTDACDAKTDATGAGTACDAANCGRQHDIETIGGAFDAVEMCAYHRHIMMCGDVIELRDGNSCAYDEWVGSVVMPAKWEPRNKKEVA